MATADEIREGQRATWAALSSGWGKWDTVVMQQLAPVGDTMIEQLAIGAAQQHLDIATGTGEPGISIARRAANGRVVLTDLVAEMLEIAARRAAEQGVTNIETTTCSADDLPFDDECFDSISVRFGYMFFPDLARATAEFARVLKPGGRLSASVWVQPERNPWTAIPMRALATEIDMPPPHPDQPNMYRCAAPGLVGSIYTAAGFGDIAETDVGVELVATSPEQYWELISEHVSPVVVALGKLDQAAHARIRDRIIADVGEFAIGDSVRVPGLARCIVGTKLHDAG